ncbi:hypothetical protein TGAM01_v207434 [Trichoderma gamsii]|uniref:Uncharacterized protein n=1 Tax=Trichoderma gamsii TaxID=398673 RepID=A0A2P4ZHN4_9HYPO|nr:hypothetical protein TGAM01_v207434 [Trichoderma gamsii]PON23787.1 hypothetical protein TGAM01_v207434 [Trichoderma gamsii]
MLGYYIAYYNRLKLVNNSKLISLPSQYSFLLDQDGEDCALINAAEFTYKYFRLLIKRPKKAYKEFCNLKVAYDECQMRCAELQAKYTADLNHKNQRIADLEMHIEEIARSRDQETIFHDTIGLTQSGGTYGGSIVTSSGHVRQGNDLADLRNQHPFTFVIYGSAHVEIQQICTPAD